MENGCPFSTLSSPLIKDGISLIVLIKQQHKTIKSDLHISKLLIALIIAKKKYVYLLKLLRQVEP